MEPRGTTQLNALPKSISKAVADEGPVLVAALAAVLVEYRRCAGQVHAGTRPEGAAGNWRSIARWEQLQG